MTATVITPRPADPAISLPFRLLAKNLLPDSVVRFGIRRLLAERLREEKRTSEEAQQRHLMRFIAQLKASPIAINTREANEQHYELPCEFFELVMGKHLKYSSCYFQPGVTSLDEAEAEMLALTCRRARIADGEDILELGCGWGSLTLWMAERYPNARITAVSNSRTQKQFIEARAASRGLSNIRIITCDMNDLALEHEQFDRVVSVEMFEHMRNYEQLLARVGSWLKPGGTLFVHIFTHRDYAYPFERPRRERLDGALLLHRRHHAERPPAHLFPAQSQAAGSLARGRHALQPHQRVLARQHGRQSCAGRADPVGHLRRGKHAPLVGVLARVLHVLR